MSDPWDELGPIYRHSAKRGKLAKHMARLNRTRKLKPTKILGVFFPDGTEMPDWNYSLKPFDGNIRTGGCIYFKMPVSTGRLSVYFLADERS